MGMHPALFAMKSIQHVRESFWSWFKDEAYFKSRYNDILFWGRQEALANDFEKLKNILHLPKNLILPQNDLESHKSPKNSNIYLDNKAVENLKCYYKRDYDFIKLCESMIICNSSQKI